jgi:hypothetical protein
VRRGLAIVLARRRLEEAPLRLCLSALLQMCGIAVPFCHARFCGGGWHVLCVIARLPLHIYQHILHMHACLQLACGGRDQQECPC